MMLAPDLQKQAAGRNDLAAIVQRSMTTWEDLSDFSVTLVPVGRDVAVGRVTSGVEYLRDIHARFVKIRLNSNVGFQDATSEGILPIKLATLRDLYSHLHCEAVVENPNLVSEDSVSTSVRFTPADWLHINCPAAVVKPNVDSTRLYRVDGQLCFNPFRGFPYYRETVTDEEAAGGQTIVDWLKEFPCDSNEKVVNFLMDLLAQKRQHPFEKIGKIVAMTGEQGTGKNTLALDIVGNLFPKEATAYIGNQKLFTGVFNGELDGKLLVYLDEVVVADRRSADLIKSYTNDTLTINAKFMAPYRTENQFELFIASNNENFVPVETRDRRYLVLRFPKRTKESEQAIKNVHDAISNGGLFGLDKILRERLVTTDFKDNNCIPFTEIKLTNLISTSPAWVQTLIDVFVSDEIPSDGDDVGLKFLGPIRAKILYESLKYASGRKDFPTSTMFGRLLTRHFTNSMPRTNDNRSRYYEVRPWYFLEDLDRFLGYGNVEQLGEFLGRKVDIPTNEVPF